MEHKFVKRELLPNGNYFNGRGFYKKEEFIPDGWGQILYDDSEVNPLWDNHNIKNSPVAQSGISGIVNEVWDFISSIYNINYNEWIQRVISSYKGIPFETCKS